MTNVTGLEDDSPPAGRASKTFQDAQMDGFAHERPCRAGANTHPQRVAAIDFILLMSIIFWSMGISGSIVK